MAFSLLFSHSCVEWNGRFTSLLCNTDDYGYLALFGMEGRILEASLQHLRVVVNVTDQVGVADTIGNIS